MSPSAFESLSSPPGRGLEGERRVVTILFCDVKGSTAMAEHLDPEEWAEIMNEAFGYLTGPVNRYGGTVARLMGDAILAFFGAPSAHEDDPLRAVLAGLDILEGIRPFCEQIQEEYRLEFSVRVGINTGPVVVGEMGTALAGEYTAMGDAVNVAARMEQTALPGSVQIAEDTYRLVLPWVEVEALGEIEVKGKVETVAAYRVLRRKEHPGRARGIAGLTSPLVGRDRQLVQLCQAHTDLHNGRGQIVTLIGEAGLGKSRLVEELHGCVGQMKDERMFWIESRGISYESTHPYGLFQQHMRQVHDLSADDPPEEIHRKFAETFPWLEAGQLEAIVSTARLLLDVGASGDTGGPLLEGEAVRRQIFEASLAMWRGLAEQAPLLMIFDDLQWADPASVELLLHLFQLVDQAPILFICAFRPYRQSPAWRVKTAAETEYPHRYIEINLTQLSDEESWELVSSLLSLPDLPAGLRQLILRKSEGNPFFLEEVVRTLIERGIVQRDASGLRWVAVKSFEAIDIPDNLQALLLARIDRLRPEARRTLQLAAVIGRNFTYPILKAMSVAALLEENGSLERWLSDLERVEIIRQVALKPEREYVFRNELTRDAAYQSILRRQRRAYHRAVAGAIEQLYPERMDQEAYRLAYHFDQARDDERAMAYYVRAGQAAGKLYANAEASGHYQRALEIARRREAPNAELISIYTCLGRALELDNHYDQALGVYQELERLGRERGDDALVLAALNPMAAIYSVPTSKFSPEEGRKLSLDALGLARLLGDPRAEAKSLWNLLLIETFAAKDIAQAVDYGERAEAIARQHGLKEELAYALHDLSRAYMASIRMSDSLAAVKQANQLWRELENLPMLADNQATMAEELYLMGEFDQALASAQEGLRISEKIRSPWGMSYALTTIGLVGLERGDLDQGIQALEEGIVYGEQANFYATQVSHRLIIAWMHLTLGDKEGAKTIWEQVPEWDNFWIGSNVLREVLWHTYAGEPELARQALAEFEKSVNMAELTMYFGPVVYDFTMEVLLLNDEYDAVLEKTNDLIQQFEAGGMRLFTPDLWHKRGQALRALGRGAEALQATLEARSLAMAQVSRRSLWAILSDLVLMAPEAESAEAYRKEGEEVVGYISNHIHDPQLRAAFLNLPAVRRLTGSLIS